MTEGETATETDLLNKLSSVLTDLQQDPHSLLLHKEHIRLHDALQLPADQALDLCIQNVAASPKIWLRILNSRRAALPEDLSDADEDAIQSILGLFGRAEEDYLSVDVLKKHVEFLIELEETGVLEADEVRVEMRRLHQVATLDIRRGNQVFDLLKDWEAEQVQKASDELKEMLTESLSAFHLAYLQTPHSEHDSTLGSYSTFTSTFRPAASYENALVHATEAKQAAVKVYSRRERFEITKDREMDWDGYIHFEKKKIDLPLLKGVYERAIASTATALWDASSPPPIPTTSSPSSAEADSLKSALSHHWLSYASLLHNQPSSTVEEERTLLSRAVRSAPYSGALWASYTRLLSLSSLEDEEEADVVEEAFTKALSVQAIATNVEEIVRVVLAKAACERRKVEEGNEEALTSCILAVETGISMVRKIKGGDGMLRLERFLADLYQTISSEPLIDMIVDLWKAAVEHYKTSYLAWSHQADALTAAKLQHQARQSLHTATASNSLILDYPEPIWEKWSLFEALYGSVDEEEECARVVGEAKAKVARKRVKDAEREYREYAAFYSAQQQQTAPVQAQPDATTSAGGAMDVGSTSDHVNGAKRKAHAEMDDTLPSTSKSKKAKLDVPLKRDRENSTIFVSNLPSAATEEDLRGVFKDCGDIREIKMTHLDAGEGDEDGKVTVATVEFMSKESIPAALTKDKKRLPASSSSRSEEIAVYLAWQSTLYITNFPASSDDASIRSLFEPYGPIFETRWPSKKFNSTRRFCYLQFAEPRAAQSALALHGTEIVAESGQKLNVYISNPERKKERTDADADAREIYVAGLAKSVTREDLEGLFKQFGSIKDIRVATDDTGGAKGFAFIEFDDEASSQKALAANNYELKKRRLAVTLADSRAHAKQRGPTTTGQSRKSEKLNRSVRILNLPEGTQDGLLQQTIEKFALVERVYVIAEKNEAVVELPNAAEAGKLLLSSTTDPVVFNGNTLAFVEETLKPGTTSQTQKATTEGTEAQFVPRSTLGRSRPRAGLGSKSRGGGKGKGTSETRGGAAFVKSVSKDSLGQDAFRQMLNK